ncbi:MAG: heavy metal-associated domain-containing protein [Flavobacteriales bacterium]
MSFLSENVIPGNYGKIFETNAKESSELEKIKNSILNVDGIRDVILNETAFPREITIHTEKVVRIDDIEKAALDAGFHAIPRTLFPL